MESILVTVDDRDHNRCAKVRGALDVFTSPSLPRRALEGLPDETNDLLLDLRGVSFVDSAGVSALVRLQQECRSRAVVVHARLGNAQHLIHSTVVDVLRRVLPVDD
jgi:anti-anti-sigma factor